MLLCSLAAHRCGASSECPRHVLFFVGFFLWRNKRKYFPDAHSNLSLLSTKTVRPILITVTLKVNSVVCTCMLFYIF